MKWSTHASKESEAMHSSLEQATRPHHHENSHSVPYFQQLINFWGVLCHFFTFWLKAIYDPLAHGLSNPVDEGSIAKSSTNEVKTNAVFENGDSHGHLASFIISFHICILSERFGNP